MNSREITLAQMFASLEDKGLIDDLSKQEETVEKLLAQEDEDESPWYIKALIGFGAWLASIFFFIFIAMSEVVPNDRYSLFITGLILLCLATYFRRTHGSTFHSQFALSVLVTGYSLTLAAGSWIVKSFFFVPVASTVLSLLLYYPNPCPIQRFLGPLTTLVVWTIWILSKWNHQLLNVLVIVEVVAAFVLLTSRRALCRPGAYAFVFSIPATFLTPILYNRISTYWLPTKIFLTFGLIYLLNWLAGGRVSLTRPPFIFAVIAIILLGCFAPPGLLAALLMLLLGHGIHNRVITALGLIFAPVFIIYFYYYLGINLAYKSWALIISGLVLLGLRQCLSRYSWDSAEQVNK